ncbi:flagellar motor switch protein FliM [Fictibacillus macauensis ZFHKF-1]|uniref:Flagellar motor switch protein FliM n=1 Tax=Fictibacillus macauensis ZFHKF-1 TaxID=1196324 RepID=I8J021_9BACL|nr:flagellar motor switch protein FliM [Fictibacillus macauensis]EIT85091.1 flagellar motor switch protein FliM [Fictibacillus macauensis ZFHKF-1]
MTEVLSQNEIDALLSAISTGEMDAEELKKEENERRIRTYDFKRALRFSKDQVRSITRVHENFARLLTTYVSAQLRTYVQISVASVDQLPYEEFIRSIPRMTILNLFEAAPLPGRLLIEVNPNIAYSMLDRLLGGHGTSVNKVASLTEIETTILSQLFRGSLSSYQEAWSTVVDIEPTMLDFEVNPQFLQMVSPNETVVVISLTTTIGETSGMMNVCLPHVVLEPVMQKLSVHYWMQHQKKTLEPEEQDWIQERIKRSDLAIIAELGRSTMTVQDLMELTEGDVLLLDQKLTAPLSVYVDEKKKFLAQPGRVNRQLAVQMLVDLKEE